MSSFKQVHSRIHSQSLDNEGHLSSTVDEQVKQQAQAKGLVKPAVTFSEDKFHSSSQQLKQSKRYRMTLDASSINAINAHSDIFQLPRPKKKKARSPSFKAIAEARKWSRTSSTGRHKSQDSEPKEGGAVARSSLMSSLEIEDDPPRPVNVGNAPARELEQVWPILVEESWRRKLLNPIMRELRGQPCFRTMTVLVLERHGIERIFEYLRPCQNLVALYLKGNRVVTRDLVQIQHLSSLRKVDLSGNDIHFLPDFEKLQKLVNLEYLQLHKNLLVGFRQLHNLTALTKLRHLTLQGNPSAKITGYRQFLIDSLPHLRSLDQFIVMDFERQDIAALFPASNIKKQKLLELNRFRPFNKDTTSWRSTRYPIELLPPEPDSPDEIEENKSPIINLRVKAQHSTSRRGTKVIEHLPSIEKVAQKRDQVRTVVTDQFSLTTDPTGINTHLKRQLYDLRRKFEYCSPILTMQKTVKMFLTRKKYFAKRHQTKLLIWALNRWNKRSHLEAFIRGTKLNREVLFQIGRVRFIQKTWRSFKRTWYLQEMLARRGQTFLRMKHVQNESFIRALKLQVRNPEASAHDKKLLFRKTEIGLLQRMGLIQYAIKVEDSTNFALKRGLKITPLEVRRSILMNLVTASYRFTRVLSHGKHLADVIQTYRKTMHAISGRTSKKPSPSLTPQDTSKSLSLRSSQLNTDLEPHNDIQNTLVECTFQNDFEVAQVIKAIASFNRRYDNVIQVFYEPFLHRYRALMTIQRWYKQVLFKRRTKPILIELPGGKYRLGSVVLTDRPITPGNTLYAHYAVLQKLTRRIQKSWRCWCLRQRVNTLIAIAKYVAKIDTTKLYLEQTIYMHLEGIVRDATGTPWHKPKADFGDTKPKEGLKVQATEPSSTRNSKLTVLKRNNLKKNAQPFGCTRQGLLERSFQFEILQKESKVRMRFSEGADSIGRYSESNLPMWFQRLSNTEVPQMRDKKKPSMFANNVLSLLHMHAGVITTQSPSVVNLSELPEVTLESDTRNTKLIKLRFASVQEAKNRAIVLALLTSCPRQSSQSFVRLYPRTSFSGLRDAQKTYRQIRRFQKDHILTDLDRHSYLAPQSMTAVQGHNGIIRKREEPFMTLLRARPRDKKSHFERFIVLGDADPRHVEERLGNALISNEVIAQLKTEESERATNLSDLVQDDNFLNKQAGRPRGQGQPSSFHQARSSALMSKPFIIKKDRDRQSSPPESTTQPQQHYQQLRTGLTSTMRVLTPGEVAQQRQKLKNNQEKLMKIESLQRKLQRMKSMVDEKTSKHPGFKKQFVKQLLPLIPKQVVRQPLKETEGSRADQDGGGGESLPLARTQTTVIEVPRTDVDYFDPSMEALNDTRINEQIQSLFEEYVRQKQAYRQAMSKTLSTPASQQTTPRKKGKTNTPQNLSRLTSAQSSSPKPQATSSIELASSKKISRTAKGKKHGQSSPQSKVLLSKFTDKRTQEKATLCEKIAAHIQNHAPIEKSRSGTDLLRLNIVKKQKLIARQSQRKIDTEFAKGFINQSNSVMNATHQSARELKRMTDRTDLKNTVLNLKQSGKSPQRKAVEQFVGPDLNKLVIDSIKPEVIHLSSPNPKANTSLSYQQSFPGSQLRRISKLKDSNSLIRKDSNVQRINVRAHTIVEKYAIKVRKEKSRDDLASMIGQDGGLTERGQKHTQSLIFDQIDNKQDQLVQSVYFGLPSEPRNEALIQDTNFGGTRLLQSHFGGGAQSERHLPMLRQKKRSLALVGPPREPYLKEPNKGTKSKPETRKTSRESQNSLNKSKIVEIFSDLNQMKRAREAAALQSLPGSTRGIGYKERPMVVNTSLRKEPPIVQKSIQARAKLQLITEQKMRQVACTHERARPLSNLPKKFSIAGHQAVSRNLGQSQTTIETIMRNRKKQEESKTLILKDSGVFNQDDIKEYLNAGLTQDDAVRDQVATKLKLEQLKDVKPEVFSYQKEEALVLPQQSMAGISRTRSHNKFTSLGRKRVLSFLPQLSKQSFGKFTPIQ